MKSQNSTFYSKSYENI